MHEGITLERHLNLSHRTSKTD